MKSVFSDIKAAAREMTNEFWFPTHKPTKQLTRKMIELAMIRGARIDNQHTLRMLGRKKISARRTT